MPKLISPYVPGQIAALMARQGWDDFREMERGAGIKYETLKSVFMNGGHHAYLRQFRGFADALEMSTDELKSVLEENDKTPIDDRFKRLYGGNLRAFSRVAGCSHPTAKALLEGKIRFETICNYDRISKALGISLQKLSEILC